MTPDERRVEDALLALSNDIGLVRESTGRIEGQLTRIPCAQHSASITALRTDISEIRSQLAVIGWLRTVRGKILAAVLVALLGVAGAVAGDAIKTTLFPTTGVQHAESH